MQSILYIHIMFVLFTLSRGLDKFKDVNVWCITWGGGSSKNFLFFSFICIKVKSWLIDWDGYELVRLLRYICSWGPQVHNVQYHSQNFEWAFNIKCSAVVLYLMFVVFHNQSLLITKVCLNRWFGNGTFSLSLFFLSLKHQLRHNVKGQIWFQVKIF